MCSKDRFFGGGFKVDLLCEPMLRAKCWGSICQEVLVGTSWGFYSSLTEGCRLDSPAILTP